MHARSSLGERIVTKPPSISTTIGAVSAIVSKMMDSPVEPLPTMEEMQKRHRQELKDLQSRITQKKKNATKKTRKGVNDECAEMERQLREQQASELNSSRGEPNGLVDESIPKEDAESELLGNGAKDSKTLDESVNALSISSKPPDENHPKKPNRQKARLARRAAEQEAAIEQAEKEAANLPDLRQKEQDRMRRAYEPKGLVEHEIRSDGHCLYAAIADQIKSLDLGLSPKITVDQTDPDFLATSSGYKVTREVAASYIGQHSEDFVPFLEEPLESYVHTIRKTGEWGGHLEILALAKAYQINIKVLQGDGRIETISGSEDPNASTAWLAYYHHSYGLGEHYNSLRQKKP